MSSTPFTLRVIFTGICGFVPDRPWKDGPKKICAVLIDGREPHRLRPLRSPGENIEDEGHNSGISLDGQPELERHTGFVQIKGRNLAQTPGIPELSEAVWRLDRERLNFQFVHEGPMSAGPRLEINDLDLGGLERPVPGAEASVLTSLRWLADMPRILPTRDAPHLGRVDPDMLAAIPPGFEEHEGKGRFPVLAQVVIDHGFLSSHEVQDTTWKFAPKASNNEERTNFDTVVPRQSLAHQLALEVPGLRSCHIVATPFGKSPRPPLELSPDRSQPEIDGEPSVVEIRIANLCDDNPLGWKLPNTNPPQARDDVDFRWFYEYLHNDDRETMLEALGDRDLPFPSPDGSDNPLGDACRITRFAGGKLDELPGNQVE